MSTSMPMTPINSNSQIINLTNDSIIFDLDISEIVVTDPQITIREDVLYYLK